MGYNDLSESSLTPDERCAEANRIVGILADDMDGMTQKERTFVEQMDECKYCSVKQLFYLRDIKSKYE
jgi:hypothetical protein